MQTRNRSLVLSTILLLGGTMFHPSASAQAARGIWQDEKEADVMIARKMPASKRTLVPQAYRTLSVDREALGAVLATAPLESARGAKPPAELVLPMPDGSSARFKVEESPIMDPRLAAEFPEIKTYIGQGIDDPKLSARLDQTPQGFHAIIFTGSGSVYIDPYWRDDATKYISYRRSDFSDPTKLHKCLVEGADENAAREAQGQAAAPRPTGASLRTYRMAVACTGEYATFHGGTVALAQAAITTTVNRVTAVYEREFAIRLVLVANNSSLVFTNASTDGLTNNDANLLIDESQAKIDAIIGNANYDIGHTFSTGAGGLAGLGVVGRTGQKGLGVTGTGAPVGDPYDIDYVAHEVGHQFGGNHTFNGTTAGGNRNASTAYEPGSGSTIMAYAGIMAPEDLQSNSDDYFHTASYDEIDIYTSGASPGNVGVPTATGNTPPTIGALTSFTIPSQTPFALTASATDPNSGDVLTYCWEEFDKGAAQNPAASPRDNGASPLFRSFDPTTSPVRTFPSLNYILNNSNVPPASLGGSLVSGEFLPTTNRAMNFRVTVRDNRVGGGGSNYASTTVTSTTTSGPFALTSFNTASTIAGGSAQTISWAVANSNLAPVNCANVKISLSTDGGQTYPFVLAASTPNDGSESVNVSNVATTQARFKVEAVGNIFFDLSDANTTITQTTGPGFVEQFETGLPTANPFPNHGAPGATLSLATGDWYGLNLSSPIGTTGVFGVSDSNPFPPDASGLTTYAGMNFNSGSGASQLNTFLMSPTKTFNNGDTISFLTRTVDPATFPDRLRLLFSASGASTDAAAFTTTLLSVNEGLTTTGYPGTWTLFTATISGLPGPTAGRFAFNYNVPNGGPSGTISDFVGIDVVTYTPNLVPEIAVEQPVLTDIPDAGTKDFGSVAAGSNSSLTFTIRNTGGADLTGLTVTKDGAHASEFTVTANPTAPVTGGNTTTFTVRFAPAAAGIRTAAIHIANNDANEDPFDITLTGTGTGTGFVEQFETGLSANGANTAPPGTALSLATGDWYGLNLSSPIGTSGIFAKTDSIPFSPDASGLATFAAMNFNNGSGTAQIDTFLMSPTKTFNNGDTISFLTRTEANPATFVDRLRLLFSASGASTDAAAFTTTLLSVNEGLTTTGYPGTWTLFTATISGLPGPTSGRFAFNYNVPNSGPSGANGNFIGIDLVTYVPSTTTAPTVTSPTKTAITTSGATLGGKVASPGSASVTERGVVYSVTATNNNPLIGGTGVTKVIAPTTAQIFSVIVSGLVSGTNYSFKAYATSSVGTSYTSPVSTFTTLSKPTVTSPTKTAITTSGATLGGTVASPGSSSVTERGVVYSVTATNNNPVIGGPGVTKVVAPTTAKVFSVIVSGLASGTNYSFKAYATSSVGTSYTSPVSTFTTLSAPTVASPTKTAITISGATLGGTVASPGSSSVTERGVVYSVTATNSNPLIGGPGVTKVIAPTTAKIFSVIVSGLASGTKYSFKAFATNSVGTSYTSPVATFTTLSKPTITSPTKTVISSSGATLGGTVASPGSSSVTERGVVYSVTATNNNPLIGGTGVTKVIAPTTAKIFSVIVSGLAPGTSYSFKAFATNSVGTSYTSPVTTFTTATTVPKVTSPTKTAITSTSATLGGNVMETGGAPIIERGVVYSITTANSNPLIDGTGVTKKVATTSNRIFTVAVSGLSPGTAYSFKAYATNSVGTTYTTPVSTFTTLTSRAYHEMTAQNDTTSSAFSFTLTPTKEPGTDTSKTITITDPQSGLKYRALVVTKSPGTAQQRRIVEVSSNLLDWYSGKNHTTILQNDATVLKVRDNTPITPEIKRYIRLK